jgi:hypothetical protein
VEDVPNGLYHFRELRNLRNNFDKLPGRSSEGWILAEWYKLN